MHLLIAILFSHFLCILSDDQTTLCPCTYSTEKFSNFTICTVQADGTTIRQRRSLCFCGDELCTDSCETKCGGQIEIDSEVGCEVCSWEWEAGEWTECISDYVCGGKFCAKDQLGLQYSLQVCKCGGVVSDPSKCGHLGFPHIKNQSCTDNKCCELSISEQRNCHDLHVDVDYCNVPWKDASCNCPTETSLENCSPPTGSNPFGWSALDGSGVGCSDGLEGGSLRKCRIIGNTFDDTFDDTCYTVSPGGGYVENKTCPFSGDGVYQYSSCYASVSQKSVCCGTCSTGAGKNWRVEKDKIQDSVCWSPPLFKLDDCSDIGCCELEGGEVWTECHESETGIKWRRQKCVSADGVKMCSDSHCPIELDRDVCVRGLECTWTTTDPPSYTQCVNGKQYVIPICYCGNSTGNPENCKGVIPLNEKICSDSPCGMPPTEEVCKWQDSSYCEAACLPAVPPYSDHHDGGVTKKKENECGDWKDHRKRTNEGNYTICGKGKGDDDDAKSYIPPNCISDPKVITGFVVKTYTCYCGGVQATDDKCTEEKPPSVNTTEICTKDCPPCGWGEWSEWSNCSLPCGQCYRVRDRVCNCTGPEMTKLGDQDDHKNVTKPLIDDKGDYKGKGCNRTYCQGSCIQKVKCHLQDCVRSRNYKDWRSIKHWPAGYELKETFCGIPWKSQLSKQQTGLRDRLYNELIAANLNILNGVIPPILTVQDYMTRAGEIISRYCEKEIPTPSDDFTEAQTATFLISEFNSYSQGFVSYGLGEPTIYEPIDQPQTQNTDVPLVPIVAPSVIFGVLGIIGLVGGYYFYTKKNAVKSVRDDSYVKTDGGFISPPGTPGKKV